MGRMRARMRLIVEHEKVLERLHDLLSRAACTGKHIHDANVVATMLAHGVETLVTINVEDFSRFAADVRVVNLGDA